MRLARAAAIAGALACMAATASDPADILKNPAQEARARALFRQIRCVVCQSESIDESDADIARDLRQLVRADVAAGDTDAQIKALLVQRYGDFVLLQPPFSLGNAILWTAPFAVVLLGAGIVLARRRPKAEQPELDAAEQKRLEALLHG
ncbi:MAG TPA: cytochrome c-type biogenesis protein [Caulobacteraceae bacterium]|nr:cytochrome c-type biogenesis protein [Caulobacteraceae bacterium]